MTILYITENGITDHVARSQVAPYILELARQGFNIHLLSAEKKGQDALIEEYKVLFASAGVQWTRVRYRNKPPVFGHALTQAAMKRAARSIVQSENIHLVHCRSVPPTLIGLWLKKKFDIKYIFDFRHFYADGGMKNTKGLTRLVFRRLKHLEGSMICQADKVVCLTERAREVLTNWYLKREENASARFQVIPCCADFALFDPATVTAEDLARARQKAGILPEDFVLLYLGSLGSDYLLAEMLALFRQIMLVKPSARFLFISNNGLEQVHAECKVQGVPLERISFVSADRKEVPGYIGLADLSVMFILASVSTIGCSPIKLAELFACNVPVIANTGVGDLDNILDLQRNGSVIVKDFSKDSLRDAVEKALTFKSSSESHIRDNSREFALEEGVARYSAVYRELLNS